MARIPLALKASILLLAGCSIPVETSPSDRPIPTDAQSIADGQQIADAQCSVCHGLDQGEGSRADAMPLRQVLSNYPAETLREDFESGIIIGHPDMPNFVFGPLGADVLLAYLVSIQEETPPEE